MLEKADRGAQIGFAIFCLICAILLFGVMAEMGGMVMSGDCAWDDETCMDRAFDNFEDRIGLEPGK